jgi:L-ascorbate metabolism protein UlaG (beta-lactamase superfamily)
LEITWYGHAAFRLRERDVTAITDPYDKSIGYTLPRMRADIVTISHAAPGHNHVAAVKGEPKMFRGPGEYEVGGVFVTGIPSWHGRKRGGERLPNTIFLFEFDDLTVCHLGGLSQAPTQAQIEAMSAISVLLVPVGGDENLDASEAAEVIGALEPSIVVPMLYGLPQLTIKLDPVSKFLKEMGLPEPEPQDTLKISKASLPEETQVVVLAAKQA